MKTKCLMTLLAFGSLLLGGCGQGGALQEIPEPFDPSDSYPKLMEFQGNLDSDPVFSARELPTTRMVELKGTVKVSGPASFADLAASLDPGQRDGAVWKGPALNGCEMSQIRVTLKPGAPLSYAFLFWGWDRAGEVGKCEKVLQSIQAQGFDISLTHVRSRLGGYVKEMHLKIGPKPTR